MQLKKLTLFTNRLEELRQFYIRLLNFPVISNYTNHFCIQIGKSLLEFYKSDNHHFYHYAFNLATNHFESAKGYIQSKIELNVEEGEDEIDFDQMNARAFYFHDPAGNIVEFIVRFDYSVEKNESFTMKSLLDIGEISLTSNDVKGNGRRLNQLGLPVRNNEMIDDQGLNFIGESGCYILLGPENRKWLFSPQLSSLHPEIIELADRRVIALDEDGNMMCGKREEFRFE
ncbi:glyoxalase [Halobacillus seohaensis]|uniref:Glyoxalase n=1 Tax=Halobacillus seohaensis TaxID=447421 RepID=A0ABW2EQZ7_9BACI